MGGGEGLRFRDCLEWWVGKDPGSETAWNGGWGRTQVPRLSGMGGGEGPRFRDCLEWWVGKDPGSETVWNGGLGQCLPWLGPAGLVKNAVVATPKRMMTRQ